MNNNTSEKGKIQLFRHVGMWTVPSLIVSLSKTIVIGMVISQLTQEEFGYISIAMLIFTYGGYLQLGATDALMLRLPELYMKGDTRSIQKNLDAAMGFVLRNIILAAAVLLTLSAVFGQNKECFFAFSAYVASTILYQIFLHYLMGNRYTYNFRLTAFARLSVAASRATVQILAVLKHGFLGFLVVEGLLYLVPIIVMYKFGRIRLYGRWDRNLVGGLLKMGIPLVVISIAGIISTTIDRWFVIYWGGARAMASYGVAVYVGTIIMIFPNQALSIFSQYSREMLAKGYSKVQLLDRYMTFTISITAVLGVIGLGVDDICVTLMTTFLDKYRSTLGLLPVMILICLVRINVACINYYLIITDLKKYVLQASLVGILGIAIFNSAAIWGFDLGLIGIIWATYFACVIQLLYLGWVNFKNQAMELRKFILLMVSLALFSSGIYWGHEILMSGNCMGDKIGLISCHVGSVLVFIGVFYHLHNRGDFERILTVVRREY